MEPGPVSDKPRPVGRGANMRVAVYAATLHELADHGYARLTIENVATRAGVHKTTIYRGWGNRETLVLEALTARNQAAVLVPDTGSVHTDLAILAEQVVATAQTTAGRAILSTMLSDATRVPEIGRVLRAVFADRFAQGAPVVTRAIERGELPPGTDPVELLKTLIAPIYLRLTITGDPLDDAVTDQAVGVALAAARAGVLRGREDGAVDRQVERP